MKGRGGRACLESSECEDGTCAVWAYPRACTAQGRGQLVLARGGLCEAIGVEAGTADGGLRVLGGGLVGCMLCGGDRYEDTTSTARDGLLV